MSYCSRAAAGLYSISRSSGHCRGPWRQRPDRLGLEVVASRVLNPPKGPRRWTAGADRLRQRDDVRALLDRRVRSLVVWADRLVLPARVYRHHADSARRERLQECDEVFLGAAVPGDQQRRGTDLARWRRDVCGEPAPRGVKPGWPSAGRQIKESRCAHEPPSATPWFTVRTLPGSDGATTMGAVRLQAPRLRTRSRRNRGSPRRRQRRRERGFRDGDASAVFAVADEARGWRRYLPRGPGAAGLTLRWSRAGGALAPRLLAGGARSRRVAPRRGPFAGSSICSGPALVHFSGVAHRRVGGYRARRKGARTWNRSPPARRMRPGAVDQRPPVQVIPVDEGDSHRRRPPGRCGRFGAGRPLRRQDTGS
jgi:ribosomal protein S30